MRIKLHKAQSEPFKDLFINRTVRHSVVVASRGFGKSYLLGAAASNAVFELLELPKWVPNKNVYIIAPTYSQVTDIYFPLLEYQIGLGAYALKSSRDTGVFWFDRDVTLKLVSFEAVERLRGTGAYFVGNDEPSSWTKGVGFKDAWQGIIEPLISTRWSPARAKKYGAVSPGRSLTIGTPKGYNFLYEMYNYPELDPDWKSYHYDYTRSPLLDPKEIEKIKHRIDPIEFAREYKASFEESGVRVFYCFDRKTHVQPVEPPYPPTEEEKGEDIHIPIDFNVGYCRLTINLVNSGDNYKVVNPEPSLTRNCFEGATTSKPCNKAYTTNRKW